MPGCCFADCKHQVGNKSLSCKFFTLPTATTNGKWVNGTFRTSDAIKTWKRNLLQNVGYHGPDKAANTQKDLRICSCHFLTNQLDEDGSLLFGSVPFHSTSVQIAHPPETPTPTQRSIKRAFAAVDMSPPPLVMQSPIPRETYLPGDNLLADSKLNSPVSSLLTSPGPAAEGSPSKLRKVAMELMDENRERLQRELVELRAQLRAQEQRNEQIANDRDQYKRLCLEAQLMVAACLQSASEKAELPWGSPRTYVSIERLLYDKLFASNCKAMTGLPDHTALVMFFNICLGFAGGVLPLQYRSDRSGSDTVGSASTASIEEHINYMFFVLYVLRCGPNSFELAGMHFGFDADAASRWY